MRYDASELFTLCEDDGTQVEGERNWALCWALVQALCWALVQCTRRLAVRWMAR